MPGHVWAGCEAVQKEFVNWWHVIKSFHYRNLTVCEKIGFFCLVKSSAVGKMSLIYGLKSCDCRNQVCCVWSASVRAGRVLGMQFFCLQILIIKKNKKLIGKDFLSYFLLSKSFWCWMSLRRKVEPAFSCFLSIWLSQCAWVELDLQSRLSASSSVFLDSLLNISISGCWQ